MFFKESETLANKHPDLRSLIEKIDKKLSESDASGVARIGDYAAFFGESSNRISGIFDGYVTENTLRRIHIVECQSCQTLSSAATYKVRLAEEESFDCSNCGQDLTTQLPKQFHVHVLTDDAARQTSRMGPQSQNSISHIVLLIHGIRTTGVWQDMVALELEATSGVRAIPLGFDYFDLVSFWFPFWTRSIPVKRLIGEIRHAKAMYPQAEFSVIAHSFGTYSIFRILKDEPDLRFKRIVLCGSIVASDAPWALLQPRVQKEIVNDCGIRDVLPVTARAFSWFYGATGTFGFRKTGIRDRFHDVDHSGFFTEEFVRRFWVPLILKDQFILSPQTGKRKSPSWLLGFMSSTLFKILFWAFVGLIAWIIWKLIAWLT